MSHLDPDLKLAGLLVPVFALRRDDDLGIGDTRAVREAIGVCARQGFAVLQILPIHETIGDHSPYNPISAHALSPSLLTLSVEDVPGLRQETLDQLAPPDWIGQLRQGNVRHEMVAKLKVQLLLEAHRFFEQEHGDPEDSLAQEFATFQAAEAAWLPAYTLYRVLTREYEGNPNWQEWRPEHQSLAPAETWLRQTPDRPQRETLRRAFAFIQWVAARQWTAVRKEAEAAGVQLMGEMSFGVGRCSVDVWAWRDLFDLDWNLGTPPIAYFDTNKDSERWGQNWGFPAYRWDAHHETGFAWLRSRIRGEKKFFHLCRLDHLRGYFRAYLFPWSGGAKHGEFSKLTVEEVKERTGGRLPRFEPGPDDQPASAQQNERQGREIIGVIQEAAGDMGLVAEIMGLMPEYMRRTLDDRAVPNLTFPQLERGPDRSLSSLSRFRVLSLATYANHDHAPLAAYYTHLVEVAKAGPDGPAAIDLANLLKFVGWPDCTTPPAWNDALHLAFVRTLFATPCVLTVLLSSDWLGIPQRFNLPGSYGSDTWNERLELPLARYLDHPGYGPRVAAVTQLLRESGRIWPRPAQPPEPPAPAHLGVSAG